MKLDLSNNIEKSIRIEIPLFDLSGEKVTKGIVSDINLYGTFLTRRAKYYSAPKILKDTSEDDVLAKLLSDGEDEYGEETLKFFHYIIDKSSISSIDFDYLEDKKYYKIEISVTGRAYEINIYFQKEKEAKEVFDILIQWRFIQWRLL